MLTAIFLISQPAHAQNNGDLDALVNDIISEVIDQTAYEAKEVVRKNTGIDTRKRGYSRDVEHRSFPDDGSDETQRELSQLGEKHDREIRKLEEKLNRKLDKARDEFEREARKENKPEKVAEKRSKLEKEVDAAYRNFNEKVDTANRRYDEKRNAILNRS